METVIIGMRSITYAMKAQQLLRSKGWRCEVVRNLTHCGYSLKVWGDGEEAAAALKAAGISFGKLESGGE